MIEHKSSDSEIQSMVEETRAFWRNLAQQLVQDAIPTMEKAASQCLTVNAILIGFYVNAVAFSKLQGKALSLFSWASFLSPLSFWLISIIFALSVFWSKTYSVNLQSSTGSKDVIERIVQSKHRRLRLSYLFLVLGILLLIGVLFEFLSGIIP
jgi:di/tricarboxylate transporter